ncbi:60S ribosomal protein L36a [Sciurus carolinensis]|uniref:60S ribosomal protein L36a n=1 Tax=Sciurus carolinensis TaxID=30640 RepID=A0AA41MY65_SCICA|nr:60S ribosomal protein L36a [Sciurus carolinensis]
MYEGQGFSVCTGKQYCDGEQSGYGGQTTLLFWEKAKTKKKIVLRPVRAKPSCRSQRMLTPKRCKRFEQEVIRKEQVMQS